MPLTWSNNCQKIKKLFIHIIKIQPVNPVNFYQYDSFPCNKNRNFTKLNCSWSRYRTKENLTSTKSYIQKDWILECKHLLIIKIDKTARGEVPFHIPRQCEICTHAWNKETGFEEAQCVHRNSFRKEFVRDFFLLI